MPRKPHSNCWTIGDMDRLEQLRMAGMSTADLARELGRTTNAIRIRLSRMRIVRPSCFLRWLEVLRLNLSDAVVAQRMRCQVITVKTVRSRLRRLGYDFPDGRRKAVVASLS